VEEEALIHLLQTCQPKHELRSAFTQGQIHGSIYLEATMNCELISLLKVTCGIVWDLQGISYQGIPEEEWEALLTMREVHCQPSIGEWVRILKGSYKGDVAYVSALQEWQGISALLIPRIHIPEPMDDAAPAQCKCKRSRLRTPAALFLPHLVPKTSPIQPRLKRENIFMFRHHYLEHGLLRTSFDLTSIAQDVFFMPQCALNLFAASGHPELREARFPCCLEWRFEEEELVVLRPTNDTGRIKQIRQCEAEIELLSREGLVNVSWKDLRKLLVLGDFVQVLSGEGQGCSGWVIAVEDTNVSVVECNATDSANPLLPQSSRSQEVCPMISGLFDMLIHV
jgi:hypothetical protein